MFWNVKLEVLELLSSFGTLFFKETIPIFGRFLEVVVVVARPCLLLLVLLLLLGLDAALVEGADAGRALHQDAVGQVAGPAVRVVPLDLGRSIASVVRQFQKVTGRSTSSSSSSSSYTSSGCCCCSSGFRAVALVLEAFLEDGRRLGGGRVVQLALTGRRRVAAAGRGAAGASGGVPNCTRNQI